MRFKRLTSESASAVWKKNDAAHALQGGRSDVECERQNDHCEDEAVPGRK